MCQSLSLKLHSFSADQNSDPLLKDQKLSLSLQNIIPLGPVLSQWNPIRHPHILHNVYRNIILQRTRFGVSHNYYKSKNKAKVVLVFN
jgi:hypothetical protein